MIVLVLEADDPEVDKEDSAFDAANFDANAAATEADAAICGFVYVGYPALRNAPRPAAQHSGPVMLFVNGDSLQTVTGALMRFH